MSPVSAKVDYAMRALLELAARSNEGPVKAEVLARDQDIPVNFLWNILGELRTQGLVASMRGGDGGYWLMRPASEISVTDVLHAVEGRLLFGESVRLERSAYRGPARHLPAVWETAESSLCDFLSSLTLADILKGHVTGRRQRVERRKKSRSD